MLYMMHCLRSHPIVTESYEMTSDQIAALPPEQIPIASAILENEYSLMENRRVAALLHQRGQQDTAQDLDA